MDAGPRDVRVGAIDGEASYPLPDDPALAEASAVMNGAGHWKARRDAPAIAVCELYGGLPGHS